MADDSVLRAALRSLGDQYDPRDVARIAAEFAQTPVDDVPDPREAIAAAATRWTLIYPLANWGFWSCADDRDALADISKRLAARWGADIADAVLAVIAEHPVLEIRPYYPTQHAYDAACRALEHHRGRANDAETKLAGIHERHRRRTDRHGSGCISCGRVWPCPDYQDTTPPEASRG